MRFLAVVALLWCAGCSSAKPAPQDAGVDLTVGNCDPTMVFSSCSAQCHVPVCVVSTATCVGTQWMCDCTQVQACGLDMFGSD
jgi:hypothetical protein